MPSEGTSADHAAVGRSASLVDWMDRQYRLSAAAMLQSVSAVHLVKERPGFGQDDQAGQRLGARLAGDRLLRSRSRLFLSLAARFGGRHRCDDDADRGRNLRARSRSTMSGISSASASRSANSTVARFCDRRAASTGRPILNSSNMSDPRTNCARSLATRFSARRASIRTGRSTSRNGRGRNTTGRPCARSLSCAFWRIAASLRSRNARVRRRR